MPDMPERGQSPPPERSTGKQMHEAPASGKGTDDASRKEDANKAALEVRAPQSIVGLLRFANVK